MRAFFSVTAFISTAAAIDDYTPLFEAYGDLGPVEDITSWAQRPSLHNRSTDYYAVRTAENCVFPLEVVIVQDATSSFADDYDLMRNVELKKMVDALAIRHPGTKYSLISFKDKPIVTLGDAGDYCQRFDVPLMAADDGVLREAYGKLWSNGGNDPAENQFGAIVAAAQAKAVGWDDASIATKLVVLSTDAYPHFADDGLNKYGLKTFSGIFEENDADNQCLKEYYPSPHQVKDALHHREAYLAQLVYDGDWQNGLVRKSWEWFNNFLGQTPAFLEPTANDSSDFWDKLALVIKEIEDAECPVATTTTTEVPTTMTTTTTPPTTTVATTTPPTTTATTTTPLTTVTTTTVTTTTPPTTLTTTTPPTTTETTTTATATTEEVSTTDSECECPESCPEKPCDCDREGVLIKLRKRPARLHLVVENDKSE